MSKKITITIMLLSFISILFADQQYLAKKKFIGTANGIIVLKNTVNDSSYIILDFQGSKSYTGPECSCHFSLTSETTSGKSKFIIIYPHFDVSIFIDLSNNKSYESVKFVEDEIAVTTKEEKGIKYIIYKFRSDIALEETNGGKEKLFIDKDSILIVALKTN